MMPDVMVLGLTGINTLSLLAIAFHGGRWVQRVVHVEEEMNRITETKIEVQITRVSGEVENLAGKVDTLGADVRRIADYIMIRADGGGTHIAHAAAAGD